MSASDKKEKKRDKVVNLPLPKKCRTRVSPRSIWPDLSMQPQPESEVRDVGLIASKPDRKRRKNGIEKFVQFSSSQGDDSKIKMARNY